MRDIKVYSMRHQTAQNGSSWRFCFNINVDLSHLSFVLLASRSPPYAERRTDRQMTACAIGATVSMVGQDVNSAFHSSVIGKSSTGLPGCG